MTTKTKKRTTRAERQRVWRTDAYKRYAKQAEFKNISGAYPAPAIHGASVRKGIESYLWDYVDQHGRLPRGKHQVKMGQVNGVGYIGGTCDVYFPSTHAFNRSSFGENHEHA